MIEISLGIILISVVLYWVGGQSWAHTLFRDLGCSLCIMALAIYILGFQYSLLAILPIAWIGMTIGDHDRWQWAIHAFVISLCMAPFALFNHAWLPFALMITTVTTGTYLSSRYLSKFALDVPARAFLFATIPIWFLIK